MRAPVLGKLRLATYTARRIRQRWRSGKENPLSGTRSPPAAGLDQKLSQGFGGSAPDDRGVAASGIVAVFGAGPASLDLITNNRHTGLSGLISGVPSSAYARPLERGKFCGRLCITGIDPKTGGKKWRRLNCNTWNCSYCAPRRARTARAAIRTVAEALGLRNFLTLTLDPRKMANRELQIPYLRNCFNKFREYLRRKYKTAPKFICVVELTQRGVPHLHILLDRFIPQRWISTVWSKLGGGQHCLYQTSHSAKRGEIPLKIPHQRVAPVGSQGYTAHYYGPGDKALGFVNLTWPLSMV